MTWRDTDKYSTNWSAKVPLLSGLFTAVNSFGADPSKLRMVDGDDPCVGFLLLPGERLGWPEPPNIPENLKIKNFIIKGNSLFSRRF